MASKYTAAQDAAYLADVAKRISPDIGDLVLKVEGDQLLDVGHRVCPLLETQQYPAATGLKRTDTGSSTFWRQLNTLATTVPAAAESYCPDQLAGFEKWANTPTGSGPIAGPGTPRYSHPPRGYSSTTVDPGCESAMATAAVAAIAKEGANNPELFTAASTCSAAAQFGTALIEHPDAAGAASMDEGSAADFLQIVCKDSAAYTACADARANGWFS